MASFGVQVSPVTTPSLHREFCELPYRLYRADSHWVPPLRFLESQRWSPDHNPSLRGRWWERFVVRRNGRVAGRVAAVIDEDFCRRWRPDAGFFGFFECENDPESAGALLGAVEGALRGKHRTRILGPVNLTTNDEVGLLVDGFGSPPMVLSPYNPPYYDGLLRERGYAAQRDYHSYLWSADRPHAPAVERLLGRLGRPGLAIRPSHPRRWDADTRLLFDLYNASFAAVWGFTPLTWEEFDERAKSFRPFYDPNLVLFAEQEGRPVGFALVLPDANEALARAGGRLWPLGWLWLLLAVRRIRRARFILLGVLPEAAGAGVGPLLAHQAAEAARRRGVREAELSLVLEENRRVRHVIEAFGATRCKTYRLFEKPIAV